MAILAVLRRRFEKGLAADRASYSPWSTAGAWRANASHEEQLTLLVGEEEFTVTVCHVFNADASAAWEITTANSTVKVSGAINDHQLNVEVAGIKSKYTFAVSDGDFGLYNQDTHINFTVVAPSEGDDDENSGNTNFDAPMNGTIVAHLVKCGEKVKKGEPILVMEAMKMEHSIVAPSDGVVDSFYFEPGELVDGGAALLEFTSADAQGA